tara:strand:+ start:201 stop:644 length:444 start_codon:yes stop_codon:yes gene_type:complete
MKHWIKHCPELWLPTWDLVIGNLSANPEDALFIMEELGVAVHQVCTEEYKPILDFADTLSKQYNNAPVTAQTMISFTTRSKTYGKHNDDVDVYFLQAIGQTAFGVWEDDKQYDYILDPGDLLHIPKGLSHATMPITPRVGISYGVED